MSVDGQRSENNELLWYVHERIIPSAFTLLPGRMDSPEARAMLLAIGLQESRFKYRRQISGPARGFWQFEQGGGVAGVLKHAMTKPIIEPICNLLLYPPTPAVCHAAIEHNDVLAACFARLLLWVDPRSLPSPSESGKGWAIYLSQWRPGKPHPQTWAACYRQAWDVVGL